MQGECACWQTLYRECSGCSEWNAAAAHTIEKCYSTASLKADLDNIGGLIGYSVNFTCNDCYWATDTSGKTTSAKGVAKTRAQLMNKATFEDWKFVSVWNIEEGSTMPYLRNMPVPDSVY